MGSNAASFGWLTPNAVWAWIGEVVGALVGRLPRRRRQQTPNKREDRPVVCLCVGDRGIEARRTLPPGGVLAPPQRAEPWLALCLNVFVERRTSTKSD